MQNIEKYYLRAVQLFQKLHQCPELGFDLFETVKIVKDELEILGIPYTEKYGKSSIVLEIGKGERCVAIRADMDALPIEEKSGLMFSSKNNGCMHACGHDAHTAILLAVASYLKHNEDKLNVRVKLIFQPSEECSVSGAKMMVENGVVDDVDSIICTHCDNTLSVGEIGVRSGEYMAACVPLTIVFYGKSAHATLPSYGVDAIAMANQAYCQLKRFILENNNGSSYIWSVGKFTGGSAHNVICDKCEMDISFRFFNMQFAEFMEENVKKICSKIAEEYGGKVEVDWKISTGPVINDGNIIEKIKQIATTNGIKVNSIEQVMTSEDFGWYLQKVKGALFRFGTRNEEKGCTEQIHNSGFKMDEKGMKTAIKVFCEYILSL